MQYRCQSALKLVELEEKFRFLKRCTADTVVDLAAAPGGFSQVAVQYMEQYKADLPQGDTTNRTCLAIAVDQRFIAPLPSVHYVKANVLRHASLLRKVEPLLRQGTGGQTGAVYRPVQGVLHDGVSVVKGQRNYSVTYAQSQMVLSSLQLSCKLFLKFNSTPLPPAGIPSGVYPVFFVTKVMRCHHFPCIKQAIHEVFEEVNVHKPESSRSESNETYIVAIGAKKEALHFYHRMGRFKKGGKNPLSLSPKSGDVSKSLENTIVWHCLGCGNSRMGCVPCPLCC